MRPLALVNTMNLTTPIGWVVARLSGCRIAPRGEGWEATGYRWPFPIAGAFTVGCMVISRQRVPDAVWRHEVAHMRQYAWFGPLFWPAYGLAAGWSWVRSGDWWSRNAFERRAGLRAGGYVERPVRAAWRRQPGGSAAGVAVA